MTHEEMIRRLRWDAGINRMAADNDRRRHAEAVAEGEAALADVLSVSHERFSGAADAIEQAIALLEQANAEPVCETCDGTGVVKFCPDPSDSNCGGCESEPCPDCAKDRPDRAKAPAQTEATTDPNHASAAPTPQEQAA